MDLALPNPELIRCDGCVWILVLNEHDNDDDVAATLIMILSFW